MVLRYSSAEPIVAGSPGWGTASLSARGATCDYAKWSSLK